MNHPHVPDPDPTDMSDDPAQIASTSSEEMLADPRAHGSFDPGDEAMLSGFDTTGISEIDGAFEGIIGSPDYDIQFWQPQTTEFTCALQAQRGIIEAMTGVNVSEAQLVYEATSSGCLSDGGMSPYDAGTLLDAYGVPNHVAQGAQVSDLVAELSLGHKVIVGVDSGELWGKDPWFEDFFGQAADHAIWVTGIDQSDPAHPQVIVNDSGDPTGAGKAYDLAHFVDAWEDSGFFYVATDHAPPDYASQYSFFDAALGHIPALATYFGARVDGFEERLKELSGAPSAGLSGPADEAAGGLADLAPADRDALLRNI